MNQTDFVRKQAYGQKTQQIPEEESYVRKQGNTAKL